MRDGGDGRNQEKATRAQQRHAMRIGCPVSASNAMSLPCWRQVQPRRGIEAKCPACRAAWRNKAEAARQAAEGQPAGRR